MRSSRALSNRCTVAVLIDARMLRSRDIARYALSISTWPCLSTDWVGARVKQRLMVPSTRRPVSSSGGPVCAAYEIAATVVPSASGSFTMRYSAGRPASHAAPVSRSDASPPPGGMQMDPSSTSAASSSMAPPLRMACSHKGRHTRATAWGTCTVRQTERKDRPHAFGPSMLSSQAFERSVHRTFSRCLPDGCTVMCCTVHGLTRVLRMDRCG
mmetsp:Transcript_7842/g.23602  ORF Transcript_7842/g.23602 Transcript_7842/m.23602 type:complete len:213 (+) Transcript_7842:562-1200(+)